MRQEQFQENPNKVFEQLQGKRFIISDYRRIIFGHSNIYQINISSTFVTEKQGKAKH